jgi:hypothetical protein
MKLTCTSCGAPAVAVRPGTDPQLFDAITLDRGEPAAAWCYACWHFAFSAPGPVKICLPPDIVEHTPKEEPEPRQDNLATPFGAYRTPEAQAEVIEIIEEVLAQAKRGEITSVAIAGLRPNDKATSTWRAGGNSGWALVGAVAKLEADLLEQARQTRGE